MPSGAKFSKAKKPPTFVSSDHGDLQITDIHDIDGCLTNVGLPRMQYEHGDLLIKLSEYHWLLVHSALVGSVSPVLRASFSNAWASSANNLQTIVHPKTGNEVTMRTLALKLVDGTYLLEGKDVLVGPLDKGHPIQDLNLFQHSDFADTKWPGNPLRCRWKDGTLSLTRRALHAFFALMYGAKLNLDQFVGAKDPLSTEVVNGDTMELVGVLWAYAKYYQCLDVLKPALLRLLHSSPIYWKAVADHPSLQCNFAKTLQDPIIYFDALRHMAARAYNNATVSTRWEARTWEDLADELGCSEDAARDFFTERIDNVRQEVLPKLEKRLLKVQLQTFITKDKWRYKIRTFFFKAKELQERRGLSEGAVANQCSQFLARMLYGQWFVDQVHGDSPVVSHNGNIYPDPQPGGLSRAVELIEQAAESDNPSSIFGLEAPSRLSSFFSINKWLKFNPTKQIQRNLEDIVKEADKAIKDTLIENYYPEGFRFWNCPLYHGRAHFNTPESGYCTYMPMPVAVPWSDEPWAPPTSQGLPGQPEPEPGPELVAEGFPISSVVVDMANASSEWRKVLAKSCGVSNGKRRRDVRNRNAPFFDPTQTPFILCLVRHRASVKLGLFGLVCKSHCDMWELNVMLLPKIEWREHAFTAVNYAHAKVQLLPWSVFHNTTFRVGHHQNRISLNPTGPPFSPFLIQSPSSRMGTTSGPSASAAPSGASPKVIPSAFGDLPVVRGSVSWSALGVEKQSITYTLPALQFQDGDFLVKLSEDPQHWLFLHGAVVAAASRVLGAGSSVEWAKCSKLDTITHPTTGKKVQVRTLALCVLEGTYLLEGKTYSINQDSNDYIKTFHVSDMAEPGWSDSWPECPSLEWTVVVLRVLFALIYGAEVTAEMLPGWGHEMTWTDINHAGLHLLSAVGAYARYYQCLDSIKPGILRIIQSAPQYLEAMACCPDVHVILAKKLELEDIYFDALRHVAAQAYACENRSNAWWFIADEWKISTADARDFFTRELAPLQGKASLLKTRLWQLHLSHTSIPDYRFGTARSTFGDIQRVVYPLNDQDRPANGVNDAAEFLARSMFAQTFVQLLHGSRLYVHGSEEVRYAEPFLHLNEVIRAIEAAAQSDDPTDLFSKSSTDRFAAIFGFTTEGLSDVLRRELCNVLREAIGTIEQTFPEEEVVQWNVSGLSNAEAQKPVHGVRKRSTYDARHDGQFTYMFLPDWLPWDTAERTHRPVNRPVVNIAAASEALMEVLEQLGNKELTAMREENNVSQSTTAIDGEPRSATAGGNSLLSVQDTENDIDFANAMMALRGPRRGA
ncbi:hypothetical protein Q7P37_002311 [Cladosporium fusiforme]